MNIGVRNPGKIAAAARYHRARGHLEVASRFEAELVAAGLCRRCGRRLTDPASVKRGIGPDCAAKAPA